MVRLILILLAGIGIGDYVVDRQFQPWLSGFVHITEQGKIAACSTTLQLGSAGVMQIEKLADRAHLEITGYGIEGLKAIATYPNAAHQSTLVCRFIN